MMILDVGDDSHMIPFGNLAATWCDRQQREKMSPVDVISCIHAVHVMNFWTPKASELGDPMEIRWRSDGAFHGVFGCF